jgi:hypothetical protein
MTPGPIDFLGAREAFAVPLPDIGGYALCRRVRMVNGALGGSMAPEAPEVVDEMLLCRVDVLCLRSREAVLAGRGPVTPRPAAVPFPSVMASMGRLPPILVRPTAGYCVVKSLEDSSDMLFCRSSKLGEGRKLKEPDVFCSTGAIEPKEKRE